MDMENIDFGKLKEAVKALNEVEGLMEKAGLTNIKTVAVKKEAMVSLFTDAIEKISEVGAEEKIPEVSIEMYNSMYSEDAGEEETTNEDEEQNVDDVLDEEDEETTAEMDEEGNVIEKKVKKEKKEKKEKAPKEKKEKKEKVPKEKKPPKEKKERVIVRSRYGQILSAKSGQLDEMMGDGTTYGEIMKTLDVSRGRIQSHIKALKNMGLTVMVKEDEDPYKTSIKVKEASLVRPTKEKTE